MWVVWVVWVVCGWHAYGWRRWCWCRVLNVLYFPNIELVITIYVNITQHNYDVTTTSPYLLALVADIVGVLPHGIVKWFLIELGGGGSDGFALHLVLVLQAHEALALHILKELHHWVQYI